MHLLGSTTKLDVFLQTQEQAKQLIRLCRGNSQLYVKRRQPESHFTQQMRMQARAERARRDVEEARLNRANAERQAALQAKAALEDKVVELEAALESCKTAGQLMAEKARYAQQEAALHEEQVVELTRLLPATAYSVCNTSNTSRLKATQSTSSCAVPGGIAINNTNSSLPTLRGDCNIISNCSANNVIGHGNPSHHNIISNVNNNRLIPGTDPLSRRRFCNGVNTAIYNSSVLCDDNYSIRHLEIELQKEKARFSLLQNHFLSELREAYCHLESVNTNSGHSNNFLDNNNNNNNNTTKFMNNNNTNSNNNINKVIYNSPSANSNRQYLNNSDNHHWQPGLDSWYEKKEFGDGPNYRAQGSSTNAWPPINMLDYAYNPHPQQTQHLTDFTTQHAGFTHTWTNDTPMMRKRVLGPLPSYYEMGGYVVNTTG